MATRLIDREDNLVDRTICHSWVCPVVITCLSALGGFLFGYDTGVISGAMIQLREHFNLSYAYQEIIVSISLLAAAIGCPVSAVLSDYIGRKIVIIIASVIFTIGAIVMGVSYDKISLLTGRLIVGLGIGVASMSVPVYIAEISPGHMRGALVTLNTVFITAGQVVAGIVDAIFISDEVNGWRYMLGIGGIPSFIQLVAFINMPESPRWLVQHGQTQKARVALQRIYGESFVTIQIENEIQRMVEALRDVELSETSQATSDVVQNSNANIDEEDCILPGKTSQFSEDARNRDNGLPSVSESSCLRSKLTLIRMLRLKTTRRALFIGCGLQMFQQFVGINTVMYYSAEILSMAGIGGMNNNKKGENAKIVWLSALVAFANFLFSLGAPWIVNTFKRRLVLYCSLTGVFLSLVVLAVSFQLITSYSIPVSVVESTNVTAVGVNIHTSCSKAKTCDMCIQKTNCGFCYQMSLSGRTMIPVNGSCLLSPVEFSPFSNYGRCTNKSMKEEHAIWAYDHCPSPYGWMTLIGLILYLASFAPGMSPLPWTINAEIYPAWARSTGVATATACNWIANLVVSLTFLSLTHSITRQGTYCLYAGVSILAIIFVWKFVPEYGDKTLEEIEMTLHSS
ncbi:Proton myo-inositol cotransporter [Schistosoma japonicum]|nr:Proton myo-inositol cotransporter [Schistosoma japonicum]